LEPLEELGGHGAWSGRREGFGYEGSTEVVEGRREVYWEVAMSVRDRSEKSE
jgi:hypothetical protein